MLWTLPTMRLSNAWSPMDRMHRDLHRLLDYLDQGPRGMSAEFPAVNIWTGEDNAILTAEVPGVDPKDIDIVVKNDTVTIRGSRTAQELKKGETYIRQERGLGQFVRSFALPFPVDAERVSALYQKGILQITLPRQEQDKPKKISVKAA